MVLKLGPFAYPGDPHAHYHMKLMIKCYNVLGEPKDDDELWNINIPETEGSRDVVAPNIPNDPMNQPLNIRNINIGME